MVDNPAAHNLEHFKELYRQTTGYDVATVAERARRQLLALTVDIVSTLTAAYIGSQVERLSRNPEKRLVATSLAVILQPGVRRTTEDVLSVIVRVRRDDVERMEVFFKRLIRTSESVLKRQPRPARDAVSRLDAEVDDSIRALKAGTGVCAEFDTIPAIRDALMIRQCIWLGQPRLFRNYFEWYDADLLTALLKRTEKMGIAVKVMINTFIAASIRGASNKGKAQFLILGKPGVGKTMLVKLVAKALNAPLVSFRHLVMDAKALTGSASRRQSDVEDEIPGARQTIAVQGALRDHVRETGIRNPLVLMDEYPGRRHAFIPSTEGAWKIFLDPDNRDDSAGLEDLSHVMLVVCSNNKKKEFEPGILNRFQVIEVPDLDEDTFSEVFDAALSELMAPRRTDVEEEVSSVKLPVAARKARKMDKGFFQAANTKAEEDCKGLKGEILERNHDPGARTVRRHLRSIFDYVLVEKLLFGDPDYSVPEEEIRELAALALNESSSSDSSSNNDSS